MSLAAPKPAKPTSEDFAQGNILWLCHEDALYISQLRRGSEQHPVMKFTTTTANAAHEGIYNHPILVVSRPAGNEFTIHFIIITSFRQKSLSARYPGNVHRQRGFIPFALADPHPLALWHGDRRYDKLELEGDGELLRGSYANVHEVFRMDWRDAELYWGADRTVRRRWNLDAASLGRVLALLEPQAEYQAGEQWQDEGPVTIPVSRTWRLWALVSTQAQRVRALIGW